MGAIHGVFPLKLTSCKLTVFDIIIIIIILIIIIVIIIIILNMIIRLLSPSWLLWPPSSSPPSFSLSLLSSLHDSARFLLFCCKFWLCWVNYPQFLKLMSITFLLCRIPYDAWHSSRTQHVVHRSSLWFRILPLPTVWLYPATPYRLDACCLPGDVSWSLWNFSWIYVSSELFFIHDNLLVHFSVGEGTLE